MTALQIILACILLIALIGFLGAYYYRSVLASKKTWQNIAEGHTSAKPIDPDEDGPGTYGGPYQRHPKYPPGGGS